jgi:hypothetical protein
MTSNMLGAGVVAGLVLGLGSSRTTRRRQGQSRARDTRAALSTYLREHLSGADAAIRVVDRLRQTQPEDHLLFEWLHDEFQAERQVVQALLANLGAAALSPKRLAAHASALVLERIAGGREGELALFRTLEALAVAVQGKRCMWRARQALHPPVPLSGPRTLPELEAAAVRQWEVIEQRRALVAAHTFSITVNASGH